MSEVSIQGSELAVLSVSDSNYLSRCATMLESAECDHFSTVLALDDGAFNLRNEFPDIAIVRLEAYLEQNPNVARSIQGRSRAEKIFSVGPSVLLSLADDVSPGGWLAYADSDLFFLSSLQNYLNQFESANVVLAPHRHYAWNKRRLAKYGAFNVGLVAFRNNEEGLRTLRFWAESCLTWCFDRAEEGKYADQKYLEAFSSIAAGVYVDASVGVNLAPWNAPLGKIAKTESGRIVVDNQPLVYFHAQGLQRTRGRWVLGHLKYFSLASSRLKRHVYRPYLTKLDGWSSRPGFENFGTSRTPQKFSARVAARVTYAFSLLLGQTIEVSDQILGASQ